MTVPSPDATAAAAGSSPGESVWVGLRVRPLIGNEAEAGEVPCCKVQNDGKTIAFCDPSPRATPRGAPAPAGVLSVSSSGGSEPSKPSFPPVAFDRSFPPSSTETDVYQAAAQPLVRGACNGYNGTVFAYGQTSSGKTFTMRPVMRHGCNDVFRFIDESPGREFLIRISAIEIYNEILNDLLSLDRSAGLKLMDCPTRGTIAEGLTEVGVESAAHLHTLLETIDRRREVRDTRMNDNSSRSHLIVKLTIESRPSGQSVAPPSNGKQHHQQHPAAMTVKTSALTFVDLAGSERSRHAGTDDAESDKQRLKEGSHINRSLLALGTVIRMLSTRGNGKHVPFRDSKLTRILQPALGGNARTAIICTVSPCLGHIEYTRSTINFALAAKKVTTRPHINEVKDTKAQIRTLQNEILALRERLEEQQLQQQQQQASAAVPSVSPVLPDAAALYEAKLSEKEELVKHTKEEAAAAKRRLKGLERLILRADPGRAMPSVRASWAPQSSGGGSSEGPGGLMLGGAAAGTDPRGSRDLNSKVLPPRSGKDSLMALAALNGAASRGSAGGGRSSLGSLRGSWNPGDSVQAYTRDVQRSRSKLGRMGPQAMERVGRESGPLLLDCFLSPSVLKHMKRCQKGGAGEEAVDSPGTIEGAKATAKEEIRKLDSMRSDESARKALEALQAEVRCMKQTQGGASDAIRILQEELGRIEEDKVIGEFLDATKEETIKAMNIEIDRLKAEQSALDTAGSALASLKERLNHIGTATEDLEEQQQQPVTPAPAAGAEPGSAASAALTPLQLQKSPSEGQALWSPGDMEVVFQTTLRSPSASPLMDSPRASMFGPLPRHPNNKEHRELQPSPLGVVPRSDKENSMGDLAGGGGGSRSLSASVATGFRLKQLLDEGGAAKGSTGDGAAAAAATVTLYREELQKVKSFKAAAEKDLGLLQSCLSEYQEQAERLDCQKRLLVGQVIKLEFRLDEAEEVHAAEQQRLSEAEGRAEASGSEAAALKAEVERLKAEAERLKAEAASLQQQQPREGSSSDSAAAAAVRNGSGSGCRLLVDPAMSMVDPDVDSWMAPLSVDTLLPKIILLWDELMVPLVHRSRFYQAFRGRELFYYEAEFRRLEHSAKLLRAPGEEDGGDAPDEAAVKEAAKRKQKARLKLQWEQQWLYSQLKWEVDEGVRLEIFDDWEVPRDVKRRKEALFAKIWANDVTKNGRSHTGMAKSAELVLRLHGQDATDGMWELVFGQEAPAPRSNSGGPIAIGLKALYKKPLKAIQTMTSPGNKTPLRRTLSSMSRGGSSTPRRFNSQPGSPAAALFAPASTSSQKGEA